MRVVLGGVVVVVPAVDVYQHRTQLQLVAILGSCVQGGLVVVGLDYALWKRLNFFDQLDEISYWVVCFFKSGCPE